MNELPPEITTLIQSILNKEAESFDLSIKLRDFPKTVAVAAWGNLLLTYDTHQRSGLVISAVEELAVLDATEYLEEMYRLQKNIQANHFERERLNMNIELLELEANTDFEKQQCPCSVYSRYQAHPSSCRNLHFISKQDLSAGMLDMVSEKYRCGCGRIWEIEIYAVSAFQYEIKWRLAPEEDLPQGERRS